jgi:ATP-binding cassette subfamily F protein 3
MLQIQDISKEYNLENVLTDVTFDVSPGEKVAIVGRNGIGKSTLLKIISGIEEYDSGEIKTSSQETISYLPQKISDEDLELITLEYILKGTQAEKHEVKKLLPEFNLNPDILDKTLTLLSGGQKTKICLIKIVLQKSDYIILDEPTNNLDKDLFKKEVGRLLKKSILLK